MTDGPLARRLPRQKGSHLGTVEAADEHSAIEEAAKQFNITPARRFKIAVMRTRVAEKQEQQ
jgi:hypothetical protein